MSAPREVDIGLLSGAESAFAAEARIRGEMHDVSREIAKARSHYESMLATARAAAEQLNAYLNRGLPPESARESGIAHSDVRRLINALSWANTNLATAAQWVCDAEDRDIDELRLVESVQL